MYKVEGISMEPTLQPGQGLLLVRLLWLAGGIHDGDIVVVSDPSGQHHMIKRVYKSGGEQVEPDFQPGETPAADYVVPEGNIYVLGDNLEHSEDSRVWGPIPLSRVDGKAIFAPGAAR
jgi:signal peptidase I